MKEPAGPGQENGVPPVDVMAVLIFVFGLTVFFYLIHVVLLPFVLAAAVAFILTPLVDWLTKRTHAPRVAVALLVFAALTAVLGTAAYFGIPLLLGEIANVVGRLPQIIEQPIQNLFGGKQFEILGETANASEIAGRLAGDLRNFLQQSSNMATLLGWTFGGVFGFFLTLTLLAYFMAGGGQIVQGLVRLLPPGWRSGTYRIVIELRPILIRYFTGIAIVIVYASLAAYLGLGVFLRLRHAAALAGLTGFLEVLPVVGPALSAIVAGIVAIQQAKSVWSIAAYVIYASALRLSIDQLIGPFVLGSAARVHPTLVIFCFLAGGALFGIVGVILAVPVALVVKVTLANIYDEAA